MPTITAREFKPGRHFLGQLPPGEDLIDAVEAFCREKSIETAIFHVSGTVTRATIGTFDPRQKVYATFSDESPYEIAGCTGTVSLKEGELAAQAQIALCDRLGKTTGGRLFSKTIVCCGEIYLQELVGSPLEKRYNAVTGQVIWQGTRPK